MTVEDLIEALMKQPLTAPVFIAGIETLYSIGSVSYDRGIVTIEIDEESGDENWPTRSRGHRG